jgi:hypothetical protein
VPPNAIPSYWRWRSLQVPGASYEHATADIARVRLKPSFERFVRIGKLKCSIRCETLLKAVAHLQDFTGNLSLSAKELITTHCRVAACHTDLVNLATFELFPCRSPSPLADQYPCAIGLVD